MLVQKTQTSDGKANKRAVTKKNEPTALDYSDVLSKHMDNQTIGLEFFLAERMKMQKLVFP